MIATTFTKQAAAELTERARTRLLEQGRALEAHKLVAARIGTVNSVCGSPVTDYAFELGLSPAVRVLDEHAAELELWIDPRATLAAATGKPVIETWIHLPLVGAALPVHLS